MVNKKSHKLVKVKPPRIAINSASAGSSTRVVYNAAGIRRLKENDFAERTARIHQLSRAERLKLHELSQPPPPVPPADDYSHGGDDVEMMADVLGGHERLLASHEGGEFQDVLDSLADEYREAQSYVVMHLIYSLSHFLKGAGREPDAIGAHEGIERNDA